MKIVISCMDRRLNEYLDSLNDGETIFLRNAGANLNGLKTTLNVLLNNENITEIKVITHTDCGAMKTVSKALNKEIELSPLANEVLVNLFKDLKSATPSELEEENTRIQKELLEEIANARGFKASVEMFDLSKVKFKDKGEHIFTLLEPSNMKYEKIIGKEGLFEHYIIQSASLEEKYVDMEIAINVLGVKKGEIVALDTSEYRKIELYASRLKINPLLKDIELTKRRI